MGNKYGDIRWKWLAERGFNVLADRHQYAYMQALWSPPEIVQGVFCESGAGTGKTTLAVLAGAYEVEMGTYDRIIYVRNAVAVRDMGYLPGGVEEKEAPYMEPFITALDHVQAGLYDRWAKPTNPKEQPKVAAVTSAFTRGITWSRSFVIVDEAQNFDLTELVTVLTRMSDDCKAVVIGSVRQVDNHRIKRIAGLTPFEVVMRHFEGERVTFHKLERNYRGRFSLHADRVQETVQRLRDE